MGEQSHHQVHHQEHDKGHGHENHNNHKSSGPFTKQELVSIEVSKRLSQFDGHHHHHHHHEHVEYRRPFNIDTNLGLFALKKLNVMNPDILKEKEKVLLKSVAPGAITHIIQGCYILSTSTFLYYTWNNFGFRGFARPQAIIGLGGVVVSYIAFQKAANYIRQLNFSLPRRKLVNDYKEKYGEKFLIDVLDPNFRLPDSAQSL